MIYDMDGVSRRAPVGGSKKGGVKRWAAKSRMGCSNCKQRRIKCDERQPRCRRCELRDEKCGYEDLNDLSISAYDSPPERMEPATSLYESKVVQPNTTQQHATPQYLSYTNRCKSRYIKAYHSPITSLNDEQLVWVSWLEHASLMARSNLGVRYLCSCIPRVAWSYQPAFNALKAFVVVLESLKRKDDEIAFARHKKEALMHANKSIQGLIHFDGPAEVVLVVATLFWMYEALAGNWKASESHLDHGWNISRQTCDQDLSEPFIAHFISAIAAAFPSTVNPRNLLSMTDEEQEKHHQNRKRHAHQFMTHALRKLRQFQRTVEAQEGVSFGRTFPEIADAERQLCSVIASWPTVVPTPRSELLTVDKIIKTQSPFVPILQNLDRFLEDGDETHLSLFETNFRPTLDQFMWLAATDDLRTRQRMIEIQYQGRRPARLATRQLKIHNPVLPVNSVG